MAMDCLSTCEECETGWSTFEEREAKAMSDWAVRLVFEVRCLKWEEHA